MIYVKKTDADGCLLKVERGKRISVHTQDPCETPITRREYACLICALRTRLDRCNPKTFTEKDWGICDG